MYIIHCQYVPGVTLQLRLGCSFVAGSRLFFRVLDGSSGAIQGRQHPLWCQW
jgi:hypothetical protein